MLPNLIVIGAQKAGTTSLHRYLAEHPEIGMSQPKELDFFSGFTWARGVDWYRSLFPPDAPVRGESSPSYTTYPFATDIPARMRATVPDARLIYLVRDPVDRMLSAHRHRRLRGFEHDAVDVAFTAPGIEGSGYVVQSRYHLQLTQYLEHFAPERILVVDQHDLLSRRHQTLQRVFAFLGVDERFESADFGALHNTSGEQLGPANSPRFEHPEAVRGRSDGPWMRLTRRALRRAGPLGGRLERALPGGTPVAELSDDLRRWLGHELFGDDVARLRALTGQRFESWGV